MNSYNLIKKEIRIHEEKFQKVFCSSFPFSSSFVKNEDDIMTLMYDHHQFIAIKEHITQNDIQEAIIYQKEQSKHYIKIDSRFPLSKEFIKTFDLEESITLTMIHTHPQDSNIHINPQVTIKDVKTDDIEKDILEIYLKNYLEEAGEKFINQYVSCFLSKAKQDARLHYLGAYINNKICGFCYYFDDGHYKVIDDLTVDKDYRHQYVASSLISYVMNISDSKLYLHADQNDTPKEMYQKMGFQAIDTLYEYICTKL